jgi:predicted metal-binding protein
MADKSSLRVIRSPRANCVLVCKKCLKRVEDGRKFRNDLKSELKRHSADLDIKRPRIVMTGCFDICPKHAVVIANGTTLHRGEYMLADNDSVAEAADALIRREKV